MCLDLGINSFEILKKNIIVEDIIEIKNLTQMNLNINLVGNFGANLIVNLVSLTIFSQLLGILIVLVEFYISKKENN